MSENQFLMPGFVDCHTHAPQFPNLGLGLDKPLLEWLDSYTFPLEKKYSDVYFASRVYDKVVVCIPYQFKNIVIILSPWVVTMVLLS